MNLTLVGVIISGITLIIVISQALNKYRKSRKKRIPNFIKLADSQLEIMVGLNLKKYTLKNIGGDAFDFEPQNSIPMKVSSISQKGTCLFEISLNIMTETIKYKSKGGTWYCQKIEFPTNSNVIISKPEKLKKAAKQPK
jgi:hypothetical protein